MPDLGITVGHVWNINQMDTATTIEIDGFLSDHMHVLNTMRVPEGEFWDSLLFLRKRELQERLKHNRLFVLAMKKPSVLIGEYNNECADIVEALNGTEEELLSEWYDLKEYGKTINCCPDDVEARYQKMLNSPDYLKHARLYVTTYGWSNCTNKFVYHHDDYQRVEEEFQKLFDQVIVVEYED